MTHSPVIKISRLPPSNYFMIFRQTEIFHNLNIFPNKIFFVILFFCTQKTSSNRFLGDAFSCLFAVIHKSLCRHIFSIFLQFISSCVFIAFLSVPSIWCATSSKPDNYFISINIFGFFFLLNFYIFLTVRVYFWSNSLVGLYE